ncbi:hypothetical protein PBR20603_02703 [Pandoraea bronchicola]|uniref:Uncharacterized protein n=1 Tax=Pandoraea bronchicola TaxID=2508287 RepID=A0A5E5BSY9_9BURK|nr:hypothetical protein PBR20603_02703 [Pandoraea bronchicola]
MGQCIAKRLPVGATPLLSSILLHGSVPRLVNDESMVAHAR